jgi:lipopolysaccharide/colanic/teichoic acid biosynthesis glycosyltransferase
MKRFLDVAFSFSLLVAVSPLFLIVIVGIKLSSAGPVFYHARRMARDRRRSACGGEPKGRDAERRQPGGYVGREFTMYKFRTMQVVHGEAASPITAVNDPRLYPFGTFLRKTKIDELPQLVNVLKGEMTFVGPRPEAPEIVRKYYTLDDLMTLRLTPGVTSPGTVYYYTHLEHTLSAAPVVDKYVRELLPAKLALDRVYLQRGTVSYDARIILRTLAVIIARMVGCKSFPEPPEVRESQHRIGVLASDHEGLDATANAMACDRSVSVRAR